MRRAQIFQIARLSIHCFRKTNYSLDCYNVLNILNDNLSLIRSISRFSYIHGHFSRINFSCWHCSAEYDPFIFFCSKCTKLQKPPDSVTYFELFKISNSFDLNIEELTKQFRFIQSQLHPDKFSLKNEYERNLSADCSSLVNKAYSSLSNPLSRALYMLELKDIAIEEGKTQMDQMFLMEIMELNEDIDGADSKKLLTLEGENQQRLAEHYATLSKTFSEGNFSKAKDLVLKIKYFVSIENRIKDIKMKSLG